jgi:hypothetical protein
MATADAARILPCPLQPIEVRPQRSILNVTVFHWAESEVGPFAELMFSVVVPPRVEGWARHPKGAFFPFLAATSSYESRRYRDRVLRVPRTDQRIEARFIERPGRVTVRVRSDGDPVLEMAVTQHEWRSSRHLLHTFSMDGPRLLKADVEISGRYTMHEQEKGRLELHGHPLTSDLTISEVSVYPFREHWLKQGCERIEAFEAV